MRCPRWGEDKGLKDQEREHLRKIQGPKQREVKFEVSWAGKDKGWWFFMGRVPGTTWAEQRARSRGRAELSWDTSPGTRSLVLFLQTRALSPSLWDFPGAAPTPRLILHPSLQTRHPQPLGTGDQHDPPSPRCHYEPRHSQRAACPHAGTATPGGLVFLGKGGWEPPSSEQRAFLISCSRSVQLT